MATTVLQGAAAAAGQGDRVGNVFFARSIQSALRVCKGISQGAQNERVDALTAPLK